MTYYENNERKDDVNRENYKVHEDHKLKTSEFGGRRDHKVHHEQKPHHEHKVHHKPTVHHQHKSHHEHKSDKKPKRKSKSKFWKISTLVLLALLILLNYSDLSRLSKEEVSTSTINFINENLLQAGDEAQLVSATKEGDLYNLKLNIAGQEIDSYVTKDGKLLFPQVIKMDESSTTTEPSAPAPVPEVTKSALPKVELYIMSHCPYGTQAEKGILPIVNLMGDKIDFELKFVNYAMHGKVELDEQLNQYCIQKEQNELFGDYLECFLTEGNGEGCLISTKVDVNKMESCVAKADKEFKISELYADQSTWSGGRYPQFNIHDAENVKYGVQGSPTLVINGAQVSSARSPAAYLATICAAFEVPPKECTESVGVSSETYSPGFGYEVGTATAASCG